MINKLSAPIKFKNDYVLIKTWIVKGDSFSAFEPFDNNSFDRFVFVFRWKWVVFQVVYRPRASFHAAYIDSVYVYHTLGNFTTPNCLKDHWYISTDFSKIHIWLDDCRKKLTRIGKL